MIVAVFNDERAEASLQDEVLPRRAPAVALSGAHLLSETTLQDCRTVGQSYGMSSMWSENFPRVSKGS
jgi:hypothetical protein